MASNYRYTDVVKEGINVARAHIPPLHESAILGEWTDMLSQGVMRGDFVVIDGKVLHTSGKDLEGLLDFNLLERTDDKKNCHWIIPEAAVEATELWLGVNGVVTLTSQGERWKQIHAVLNDATATDEALSKEAAKYGCRVGDTTPGTKPGTAPKVQSGNRDNLYAPAPHGREQERMDRIIKMISSPGGAAIALKLSRSAKPPCRIDGSPL